MELKNVVLVDGVRSAFARGGRGALVATRLDDAGATVLRALLERNPKVKPEMIEDIGLGNVLGVQELVGIGAKVVAHLAGLPAEVCSFDSDRQCGSSMETLHRIAQSIMVGATECGIALGIERMGRSLAGGGGGERNRITEFNKKLLEQTEAQRNMALDHDENFSVPFPDYILDSSPVVGMPQTAQNVAEVYGLTREAMDEFAVESHRRCAAAYENGIYADEIIPLEVETPVFDDEGKWLPDEHGEMVTFDRDQGLRPGTNMETLGQLKPIAGLQSFGDQEIRITAGNSCPTNDGISAALLMSEEKALALGLEPLARIIGRLSFGWLGDQLDKRRVASLGFIMMTLGLILFGLIPTAGIWLLVPFTILFGIGWGSLVPIRIGLIRDYFGRRRFGTILGFVTGVMMVGVMTGAPLAGWAFDTWGSYQGIWFVFAGLGVAGVLNMLTFPPLNNTTQHR